MIQSVLTVTPPTLEPRSTNDITGSWNPPTVNTSIAGTFPYYFTPDTDPDKCLLKDTMNIIVRDTPSVYGYTSPVYIIQGQSMKLNGTVATPLKDISILWTSFPNDNSISNDTVPNPYVAPLDTTLYNMKVTWNDDQSCVSNVYVTVELQDEINVPNVFAPNGAHPTWHIDKINEYTNSEVEIF